MTSATKTKDTLLQDILATFSEYGIEGMRTVMESVINEAIKAERAEFLKADLYQRTPERRGYANGFKDKSLQTRLGILELDIPQVRGLSFYPQSIEKGSRSEKALKLALAEAYVQGVSTRKVAAITEQLCGIEISSTQVSRLAKVMDDELEKFRNRPLDSFPYCILDARYEKVRHDKQVRDVAVLIALGINTQGKREVLGVSISLSEAEPHWRQFLQHLVQRGLHGVQHIVSDHHAGLEAARKSIFPSVPWQRCQFHFAQNAMAYVPKRSMREEIAWALRDIFNSPELSDARARVQQFIKKYALSAPELVQWLEENIEQCFTVYSLPREHRVKLRTTNSLENLNRQIKRRTQVACIFPNVEACLRLVSALLLEIHEDWITDTNYHLNMECLKKSKQLYDYDLSDLEIYRKKVA